MKCTARLRSLILFLSCLGLLIPSPLVAAANASGKTTTKAPTRAKKTLDVELHKDGTLVGQIVNAQGTPQAKVPVSLLRGNKVLTQTVSNRAGHFALTRISTGTYQLVAGDTQRVCRLWAPKTAPPKALRGATMVVGQGPMRAQSRANGPLAYYLGNPWIIGGIVAAAIAIPVAIHNHQIDNEDHSPTSP